MKRPVIITVWAVFLTVAGVLGIASTVWGITSGEFQEYGLYEGIYAYYVPVARIVGLVILVGIWLMRKWAFVGYVGTQLLGAAIFWISQPEWSSLAPWSGWGALGAAALFAATTFPHWRKMTWRPLPIRDASPEAPQNAHS